MVMVVLERQSLVARDHQSPAGGLSGERYRRCRLHYGGTRGRPSGLDRVVHQVLPNSAGNPHSDSDATCAEDVLEGQMWLAEQDALPSWP
ncbi:hypothetical protein N5079_14885 [Planotetraspora sp. A-T 1434]|uniref:hypothetical protein n=1 Tax=Planotetraspora sp. A-T 1434 TaxID=2979219 RepID=UPI0021BE0506|nr:hypothetical protein [Planotetraspora sp. A-T 1434]MCT9931502.1 hypothetical protein [Planotetraspora sp. A-T 1434]